jgi:hypothetical protein
LRKTEAEYWQEAAKLALAGVLDEEEAERVREVMNLPEHATVTQREAIMVKAVELAKQGKKEWMGFLRELAEQSEEQDTEENLRLPELSSMTDKELRRLEKKLRRNRKETET